MQESVVSQTLQRCQDALDEVFRLTTDLAARARALRQTVSVFLEFDAGTGTTPPRRRPRPSRRRRRPRRRRRRRAVPERGGVLRALRMRCGEADVRACEIDVAACDGRLLGVRGRGGRCGAAGRLAPRHHANHAASAAAAEAEPAENEAAEEVERDRAAACRRRHGGGARGGGESARARGGGREGRVLQERPGQVAVPAARGARVAGADGVLERRHAVEARQGAQSRALAEPRRRAAADPAAAPPVRPRSGGVGARAGSGYRVPRRRSR